MACITLQVQYLVWQHLPKRCRCKFVSIKYLSQRKKWSREQAYLQGRDMAQRWIYIMCRWKGVLCVRSTSVYFCMGFSRWFYDCSISTIFQYIRVWYIRDRPYQKITFHNTKNAPLIERRLFVSQRCKNERQVATPRSNSRTSSPWCRRFQCCLLGPS